MIGKTAGTAAKTTAARSVDSSPPTPIASEPNFSPGTVSSVFWTLLQDIKELEPVDSLVVRDSRAVSGITGASPTKLLFKTEIRPEVLEKTIVARRSKPAPEPLKTVPLPAPSHEEVETFGM